MTRIVLGYARAGVRQPLSVVSLTTLALVLAIVLAVPAALVASWRIWPRDGAWNRARALDALWTVVPPVLLVLLIVLSAGAA